MGSAVSVQPAEFISALPSHIDEELCISYGISKEDFRRQLNSGNTNTIPKALFIGLLNIRDVYLSYHAGEDELGRSNYERIKRINDTLPGLGIIPWLPAGISKSIKLPLI